MLARTSALFLAACLVFGGARIGRAAGKDDPTRSEARERYERGKQLYDEHDYAGALAEFIRAQQLIPAPVTLLNIGRLYAALNRPVDAVTALDQVLASPGPLKPDQIEMARRTRDEQKRRVARLAVTTDVPAALEVDGFPVGRTPLSEPLRVAGGTHIVTALARGFLPARKEITLAGETSGALVFHLEPSDAKAAHLTVKSALPDAEVVIDGQTVARTPLPSSLTLIPGHRTVELRRPGYRPSRKEITLGDGASGELAFDLEEDPAAATDGWGALVLSLSEDEAEISIDGRSRGIYRQSLRLPAGAHVLRVERGGFEPAERLVEVRPRAESVVRVTLQPTPDTRIAYVQRTRRHRTWGWGSAVVGAGVAAAATAFVVITNDKLNDARQRRDAIDATFVMGGACDAKADTPHTKCEQEQSDAYDKVNSLGLQRTFGLVGLGVGAAALATGVVLLIGNDDPHKYDRPEETLSLVPLGWIDAGGFRLGLRATF